MITALSAPTWTDAAEQALETFFADRLAPGRLDGADPDELRADIRTHLEEEFSAAGVSVVTAEHVAQALTRMGESPAGMSEDSGDAPPRSRALPWRAVDRRPGFRRTGWFLFLAVIFPAFAIGFELLTGGSSVVLFDPIPDAAHLLLVLLAPAAGLTLWRAAKPGARRSLVRRAGPVAGVGLAAAVYYAALYLVVLPMAIPGVLWLGIGLLPMAPLFAALALGRGVGVLRRVRKAAGMSPRSGARIAFLLAVAGILLLELPAAITRVEISRVRSAPDDPETLAGAARTIRRFGSVTTLHRACYDGSVDRLFNGSAQDPVAWIAGILPAPRTSRGGRPDSNAAETARDLYFRVTGRSFNGTPRPLRSRAPLPFAGIPARQFDDARGGGRVAGRIDDLSLGESRIDWHCERASGLTWGEWTLVFRNSGAEAHEARCRIALPPDGFVSRVTLWVAGEPQEAAYSTVVRVREAYQKVAVRQNRDPVLVTQPEPGSILLQAFPVPAGGELKTRVTFTVPPDADGRVWLPAIAERNFGWSGGHRHPLWIQADGGSLSGPAGVDAHSVREQNHPTLTASLPDDLLEGAGTYFTWQADPDPVVWCADPFAAATGGPEFVVRTRGESGTAPAGAVAWVIDSSASLRGFEDAIRAAVRAWPDGGASRVFLPGDAPGELRDGDPDLLDSWKPTGGRDNSPALLAALEWLRGQPDPVLVWVHGPQPAASASSQALEQLFDRSPSRLTLLDLPLVPGENALAPVFNNRPQVAARNVRHRDGGIADSLRAALRVSGDRFDAVRDRSAIPDGAREVGDSLARAFARTESAKLAAADPEAASRLAATHQLVTPLSGAVVLERASDYTDAGLTQTDASVSQTVPVVPEPSTSLLALFAAALATLRRRR